MKFKTSLSLSQQKLKILHIWLTHQSEVLIFYFDMKKILNQNFQNFLEKRRSNIRVIKFRVCLHTLYSKVPPPQKKKKWHALFLLQKPWARPTSRTPVPGRLSKFQNFQNVFFWYPGIFQNLERVLRGAQKALSLGGGGLYYNFQNMKFRLSVFHKISKISVQNFFHVKIENQRSLLMG